MTITPPIIISDDLELRVFRSQTDAERFVEARDVVSGRLRAWDMTGRPLRLDIEDAMCIDLAPVALSDRVRPDEAAGELASTLRTFLRGVGATPPESASVAELVQAVVTFVGFTR